MMSRLLLSLGSVTKRNTIYRSIWDGYFTKSGQFQQLKGRTILTSAAEAVRRNMNKARTGSRKPIWRGKWNRFYPAYDGCRITSRRLNYRKNGCPVFAAAKSKKIGIM